MGLSTYQKRKNEIRQTAADFLNTNKAKPELLDSLELFIFDDTAHFCKSSTIKAMGLSNDLETQPVPVLEYDLQNNHFKFLNGGKRYFYT